MELKSLIASMMFVTLCGVATSGFPARSAPSPGYVRDSEGHVVHDDEGGCVRTSEWSPHNAIVQCDPELFENSDRTAMKPAAGSRVIAEARAKTYPPLSDTRTQNEQVTVYGDALFAFNNSKLSAGDRHQLDELVAKVKMMPEVTTIRVTGYTDNVGTPEYNMTLSLRRAEAAQRYLVARGIDPKRIVIVGMGEADPAATNATPAGRAQNRRVEIKIHTEQKLASSY